MLIYGVFDDNEVSLLSFKNLEMLIAIQPVRAADRLPAVRCYACNCGRLSIGHGGRGRCASIAGDVAAKWKARIRRVGRQRCTVSWLLRKTKPSAQRGRTSVHCNYSISVLESEFSERSLFAKQKSILRQELLRHKNSRIALCQFLSLFMFLLL